MEAKPNPPIDGEGGNPPQQPEGGDPNAAPKGEGEGTPKKPEEKIETPPTRNDPKDHIIKRLKDKQAKPATPPLDKDGNPITPVSEDDEEAIKRVVEKMYGPKLDALDANAAGAVDQNMDREVDTYIQKNPVFKPYEEEIRQYFKDPSRSQIPLESVVNEIFGAAVIKNLKKEQADNNAGQFNLSGRAIPQTKPNTGKDWGAASKEELDAEVARVKRGG